MKQFLILSFCLTIGICAAQQTNSVNTCEKVKNTYQVLVQNKRVKPALTTDICYIIENERKSDEIVYYKYSDKITFKIYPTSQLEKLPKDMPYIIYQGQE